MSDPVAIAIIAAVGSAVQVLGLAWLNRKQKERLSDVHAAITETKEAMVVPTGIPAPEMTLLFSRTPDPAVTAVTVSLLLLKVN